MKKQCSCIKIMTLVLCLSTVSPVQAWWLQEMQSSVQRYWKVMVAAATIALVGIYAYFRPRTTTKRDTLPKNTDQEPAAQQEPHEISKNIHQQGNGTSIVAERRDERVAGNKSLVASTLSAMSSEARVSEELQKSLREHRLIKKFKTVFGDDAQHLIDADPHNRYGLKNKVFIAPGFALHNNELSIKPMARAVYYVPKQWLFILGPQPKDDVVYYVYEHAIMRADASYIPKAIFDHHDEGYRLLQVFLKHIKQVVSSFYSQAKAIKASPTSVWVSTLGERSNHPTLYYVTHNQYVHLGYYAYVSELTKNTITELSKQHFDIEMREVVDDDEYERLQDVLNDAEIKVEKTRSYHQHTASLEHIEQSITTFLSIIEKGNREVASFNEVTTLSERLCKPLYNCRAIDFIAFGMYKKKLEGYKKFVEENVKKIDRLLGTVAKKYVENKPFYVHYTTAKDTNSDLIKGTIMPALQRIHNAVSCSQ